MGLMQNAVSCLFIPETAVTKLKNKRKSLVHHRSSTDKNHIFIFKHLNKRKEVMC